MAKSHQNFLKSSHLMFVDFSMSWLSMPNDNDPYLSIVYHCLSLDSLGMLLAKYTSHQLAASSASNDSIANYAAFRRIFVVRFKVC